jgi:diphosphomevalonate decarboxylase
MTYHSSWRAPSNIALIKYWGKHGLQLPHNPSISFTLSACHTNMHIRVSPGHSNPEIQVLYDGQPQTAFEPKIRSFFTRIDNQFPWLKESLVVIESINTFPHGAGIASSASAMSSIALCLMDIHDQIHGGSQVEPKARWSLISEVARLGSGSACRSLFPEAAIWGQAAHIPGSSDEYAIPWSDQIHPLYKSFQDTILVVSAAEKVVSSTAGHELMNDLPYAAPRYAQARHHLNQLVDCMRDEGAIEHFMSIVESEALQLHALMMSGPTPFILMEPGTLSIINELWRFRKITHIPVCFRLDAGPNVHLLYPETHTPVVMGWIKSNLVPFCVDGYFIPDHVGSGPVKIT